MKRKHDAIRTKLADVLMWVYRDKREADPGRLANGCVEASEGFGRNRSALTEMAYITCG